MCIITLPVNQPSTHRKGKNQTQVPKVPTIGLSINLPDINYGIE